MTIKNTVDGFWKDYNLLSQSYNRTILFVDIVGSSALYQKVGNRPAKKSVDQTLNALREIVNRFGGKVIKSIGDELMCSFAVADKALLAAVTMQSNTGRITAGQEFYLSIGLCFGEVIRDKADLFGAAVNNAAYLTKLAKGQQILLSESVFARLSRENQSIVREYDRIVYKGATQPGLIYRAYWQDESELGNETGLHTAAIFAEKVDAELELTVKGKRHRVCSSMTPYIIGRDPLQCDLIVNGDAVSRQHCEIRSRRGKFVLADHSTNGCYVETGNHQSLYIRREEFPIMGPLKLFLGVPPTSESSREALIQVRLINTK